MRIVLVVNSMGTGGAERVASTLANAWVRRGDSVTLIVTYGASGESSYTLDSKVRVTYPKGASQTGVSRALGYKGRVRALRQTIVDERPDVIVSFLTNVNITTVLATRGLAIPVVLSEHTNPLADGRSLFWRYLVRWFYPKADAVTLLTDGVVKEFQRQTPGVRSVFVIPNPLPNELLLLNSAHRLMSTKKTIIAVGRLQPLKQFDHLISAFANLVEDFPEWNLRILGEGPQREELEAQVDHLSLRNRAFLPGRTAQPWEEMARADAFVLCSRHEGMPMAMMEAMALGLPVVAYDCPSGPRELTRGGQDGVLVTEREPTALATALRALMSDARRQSDLGAKARDSVIRRFSINAVLEKWDVLFSNVGVKVVKK